MNRTLLKHASWIRSQAKPTMTTASAAVRGFSQRSTRTLQEEQQNHTFDHLDAVTTGTNANYLEYLEEQWTRDPNSVDVYWRQYFESISEDGKVSETLRERLRYELAMTRRTASADAAGATTATSAREDSNFQSEVMALVRAFQVGGHSIARLDPLGLYDADLNANIPAELVIENYHFTEEDMDRPVHLDIGGGETKGFLGHSSQPMVLRDLINRLKSAYCDTIGVEYMHIMNREQCNWIRERVELPQKFQYSTEERKVILDRLMFSDSFEVFLSNKFPTAKRFGLEGLESFIPGIKATIDTSAGLGVEHVIIGVAHRGRLNMLANVLRKPLEVIFSEFLGTSTTDFGSGDVKYHLGASTKRTLTHSTNTDVFVTLCANPSHLEAVNPVVVGKTRAKQFHLGDTEMKKVMPILVHGDAAFAGQGVVYETFEMANLHDYTVGGTIHIVVNNQIGFTTNPHQSRSTAYCTDLAKALSAPILHVNADDVEAVVRCCQIAAEWRQTFGKDIVVDIVGFRKHGHNELDQPMFTQPIMYTAIAKHKPVLQQYVEKLVGENVVSQEEVDAMQERVKKIFEDAFERSKEGTYMSSEWLGKESNWRNMYHPRVMATPKPTGAPMELLKQVGQALTTYPSDFNINKVLKRILDQKAETIESGKNLDWSTGEALAFGTLLMEGHHVRLSGQDVQRGTFSHRHAVLVDQKTEKRYCPLNNIAPNQAPMHVTNSPLSEYGVLGFEYGYSLEHPDNLVLWEAQFGDFANGAQIVIDQFISSGEQKWLKMSGLVMLLPHGYEGQGPEHSSARLERFLQLSDEEPHVYPEDFTRQIQNTNMQVCNLTTPANYFHALRRQLKRDFRKPLVITSPKSLLRHRRAVSTLEDMAEGTMFQKLIPEHDDTLVVPEKMRRLVFCSGKVYYDLLAYREEHKINDVALVRVEQLAPFPFDLVAEQLKKYPNAEVVWSQEEPVNQGAWYHFYFRCLTSLRHIGDSRIPTYVGRAASASTATGYPNVHKEEQDLLVRQTFE